MGYLPDQMQSANYAPSRSFSLGTESLNPRCVEPKVREVRRETRTRCPLVAKDWWAHSNSAQLSSRRPGLPKCSVSRETYTRLLVEQTLDRMSRRLVSCFT